MTDVGQTLTVPFLPHGQCFLWQPSLLWVHVVSDVLITSAYYVISASLFYFLHKRHDIPFKWMFVLFGLFIFACGTTHVMEIWTIWSADYWAEGGIKGITAALSFSTAALIIPLLPKAMALRSPTDLEAVNGELQAALSQRDEAFAIQQSAQTQLLHRTEDLVRHQQHLRRLSSEVILVEQRERRRLATDLHDYLAQLLVVAQLKVCELTQSQKNTEGRLSDLKRMLDECLNYTRTLVSELCPMALYQSTLPNLLSQLVEQMRRHDLTVTVRHSGTDIRLNEDQTVLLYRTVRELLFNVLKHSGTSSAIVTLRETAEQSLELTIQDNGKGFDTTVLTPHYAIPRKFGLFSIHERVEALGGRFTLISTPGRGTTATITIPLPRSEARVSPALRPASTCEPPRLADPRSTTRVLVVDDHTLVRQGIVSLLAQHLDVEIVAEAANGEEAVAKSHLCHPDVVLMDINMPGINGIEATRQICRELPAVQVIGLSVNEEPHMIQTLKEAGAVDFLSKGSVAEELYSAIRTCMDSPPEDEQIPGGPMGSSHAA